MTRWTRLAVDSHGRIHSLLYDINSINNEACKLKGLTHSLYTVLNSFQNNIINSATNNYLQVRKAPAGWIKRLNYSGK
jgi:hypothetical protein